jgi:hypothetical protein
LTPYDALATGTKNFARYLNVLDEVGTVTAGKRADLLLLDNNPLEDITNIKRRAGVMIGGRWFSREDLDDALLAFPRQWFRTEVAQAGVLNSQLPKESRRQFETHMKEFMASSDSLLAFAPASPEYGPRVQQLAGQLAAMREALTSAEHGAFDTIAQAWLGVQARRGHRLTVLGVADKPTPEPKASTRAD